LACKQHGLISQQKLPSAPTSEGGNTAFLKKKKKMANHKLAPNNAPPRSSFAISLPILLGKPLYHKRRVLGRGATDCRNPSSSIDRPESGHVSNFWRACLCTLHLICLLSVLSTQMYSELNDRLKDMRFKLVKLTYEVDGGLYYVR
jgi:hypothetical protein